MSHTHMISRGLTRWAMGAGTPGAVEGLARPDRIAELKQRLYLVNRAIASLQRVEDLRRTDINKRYKES